MIRMSPRCRAVVCLTLLAFLTGCPATDKKDPKDKPPPEPTPPPPAKQATAAPPVYSGSSDAFFEDVKKNVADAATKYTTRPSRWRACSST